MSSRRQGAAREILDALFEISLSTGNLDGARSAADELKHVAAKLNAPTLTAIAARANGAVHLAAGDFLGALKILTGRWSAFASLMRLMTRRVYRFSWHGRIAAQGDRNTAELELDAA